MFHLVHDDIATLANIALALLDMISAALSVALIYLAFVERALNRNLPNRDLTKRIFGFIFVCAATLTIAHWLTEQRILLIAGLWLLVGGCVCVGLYWRVIRSQKKSDDFRIPYLMMVWGGGWFLSLFAFVVLWVTRDSLRLELHSHLSIDTVVQTASIALTAVGVVFTYIMKSDQSIRAAKQEIYQTLELQSIDLFRFEADKPNLVKMLWFAKAPPQDEANRYHVKQYICQMLNLFEMAYRFRVDGVMSPDVFGSWVIWIWELCSNPVFQKYWKDKKDDLPFNYIPTFRTVVDEAVARAKSKKDCESYFHWLGGQINCREISKWLDKSDSVAGNHPDGTNARDVASAVFMSKMSKA